MTSPVYGMDVAAVRALATAMNTQADALEGIKVSLTTQLDGTVWTGPDADSFRQEWTSQFLPWITSVADGLRMWSLRANQNAQEQEVASAGGYGVLGTVE